MRPKSMILLLLALGCGLVASIGISQVMESRKNQGPSDVLEPIFVAMTDISHSDKITPQQIRLEEWPKSKIPAGALTKLEDVEGKHSRSKIFAGEPILAAKLVGPNDVEDPSGQIPKGYRAVPVRVDAVTASGSLIRPGDRVDVLVYLVRNENSGINDTSVRTVLQDIKVFAVNEAFVGKADKEELGSTPKFVSLEVTPSQAEKVMLASEMGNIRLVLRGTDDGSESTGEGTTVGRLFGGADKGDRDAGRDSNKDTAASNSLLDLLNSQKRAVTPPIVADRAGPWKMTILKGSELSEVEFALDGKLPRLVNSVNATSGLPARLPSTTRTGPPTTGTPSKADDQETDEATE